MAAKYFEEFVEGEEYTTPSRTVSEADIVLFSALSWDNASMHTDEEYAKGQPFGQRIAQGLLVVSMYSGLKQKLGIVDGTTVGFLGMDLKIPGPTVIGDTITANIKVMETRLTSRGDRGTVKSRFQIVNQRGEVCVEGTETLLMQCKPAEDH
ncbi:dehydratase [Pseudomaricurvus alkylphenolicus]|jgi:acyl dehydratase|uniref:MaoC/PaaZ C-terminal domain-containing protein n=1 Tax=Pseudomaricurvus alkylphenolicus TaxID=1306991 RepID=UPI0014246D97|nr:MaoC/PaaZ C-terminal domain-containing protein [Pseudomaricurvus alkylphenolicus]NIB41710.1 dehydratase [Pseudomaricurvus alkylphenolicus]